MASCSFDMFRKVQTDYTLNAQTTDTETAEYLNTILNARLAEKIRTLAADDTPDLRARQESDIEQTLRADLIKALHARGYYSADARFRDNDKPLSGQYDIDYGAQYTIKSLLVLPQSYAHALPPDAPVAGAPLIATDILAAQIGLRDNIGREGCYFDLAVENEVSLDHVSHSGNVRLLVTAGHEGRFDTLAFEGNDTLKERYLRRLAPWKKGDCFRREKLEDYKTTLLQTGLFSQADIRLPETGPDEQGNVPVTLVLKERAHRTISAGLTYYSDEGPGGTLGWEHRNLLGGAEKFNAALSLSMLKQSLDADFKKPYFMHRNQSLLLNAALRRQDTDAFEELAIDFGGSIERKFNRRLSGTTGADLSLLRIDDHTLKTSETYGLLSLPQTLSYDSRDDILDPRRGINANINLEPFLDVLGQADPFFKTQATASTYFPFGDSRTLLAVKGSLAAIWGADINAVPATERFYAGGGGTVRGYGYQEVGPQKNGDPTGGLSMATLSLELRTQFNDKFGGVTFVDAGSVSEESTPDFSNMAVGAGLGVRYFTSFGPIRFDVATPLTQKENTDQSVQFYISIGQAF